MAGRAAAVATMDATVPATILILTLSGAQVPADEAGRAAAGMARFHCYNTAALASLDSYLRLDAAHGIESAAVVWGGEC